ncbi:AAA family ATPase [Kitasatospora sp. NBC_01287]|uniref:AAA family ATPase n=1 Tax=Kitasatospora sp. NBC_01287 TaxID=2903573 RepID=UPI00224E808D|nr:AAA family ATPase [Kitasatospora sp. NBC_01287]MCX4750116.1 AAA family ATPase [Kitasatospora sp. NBC_01287]
MSTPASWSDRSASRGGDEQRGERFRGLRLSTDEPFTVLYGPGVDDIFVDPDYRVRGLEEVLWRLLRAEGYQRIVYSSLSRPLYFRDPESRRLSRPDAAAPAAGPGPLMRNPGLRGPLGRLRLGGDTGTPLPARDVAAGQAPPARAVADPFAVMTHHGYLRHRAVRSAVVYTQAEEILRHHQAARQLAGALADQARDHLSGNRWIFVFRQATLGEAERLVAAQGAYPALAGFIRAQIEQSALGGAFRVDLPQDAELGRLIQRLRLQEGLRIGDWQELEPVLRSFAGRPRRASAWREDLRGLITDGTALSRRAVLDRGLVTSVTPYDDTPWARLRAMPGLEPIKRHLRALRDRTESTRELVARGVTPRDPGAHHLVFSGNPGTGKTTVARLVGEIYRDLGLLHRGHLVEAKAPDLVAGFVGQTAERTNALIDRALDGVLFIDEAHGLSDQQDGFGGEAITSLVQRMENDRGRLVVVVAGYPAKMAEFLEADQGLADRFAAQIHFPDYDPETLHAILLGMLADRGLHPDEAAHQQLRAVLAGMYRVRTEKFGNARAVRLLAEALSGAWQGRVRKEVDLPLLPEDLPSEYQAYLPRPAPAAADLLAELDHLVGLPKVREFLTGMTELLAFRQARGLELTRPPHLLFLGPPGTGKTTVARLVGRILHALGLLHSDKVVEVTRAELVGQYIGETAQKTKEVVRSALDGVLFIDEAYSLAAGPGRQDYGREAVDTLTREMMENPGRLVVIAAGYPHEMREFLDANSGLRSRFTRTLHFDHYPTADLVKILRRRAEADRYLLSAEAAQRAAAWFDARRAAQPRDFGNARAVGELLEAMEIRLAQRLGRSGWQGPATEPVGFTAEDVPPP